MSLLAGDRILCIENSKDWTEKMLELMNEFSTDTCYKINMQKSVTFLYINKELFKNSTPVISFSLRKKHQQSGQIIFGKFATLF